MARIEYLLTLLHDDPSIPIPKCVHLDLKTQNPQIDPHGLLNLHPSALDFYPFFAMPMQYIKSGVLFNVSMQHK